MFPLLDLFIEKIRRTAQECYDSETGREIRKQYDYYFRWAHLLLFAPHRWRYSFARRYFLMGVCGTLTLPPFYLFPLAIPAYGGLFLGLRAATNLKEAARMGFFWGWGFYISGLYWLVIALMTDLDKFAWLMPFALFGLTALIALYPCLCAWSYAWLLRRAPSLRTDPVRGAVCFVLCWTAIEYLRGHGFGGFPWNLGGYVFTASNASIQLGAWLNIYVLTGLVVWLALSCFLPRRIMLRSYGLLLCLLLWGGWRAETAPLRFVPGVNLRLVQANVSQHHKWDPALQMQGLKAYMDLTRAPGIEEVTHVIWPETAVPYLLKEHTDLAHSLGRVLLPGQHLMTGVLTPAGDSVSNSIAVMNMRGDILARYQKHHLVPFGEFLPFRFLIPDALETPVGMLDMQPGEGIKTENWPGLPPVSPLICYESIFPGQVALDASRPAWMLTITNDAWFGTSTAPYQHLAMARMRAVEEGLPLIRVANTGVTAVYDAYGRELKRIPLNRSGVLDTPLPLPAR